MFCLAHKSLGLEEESGVVVAPSLRSCLQISSRDGCISLWSNEAQKAELHLGEIA
jgi:hypothetical protein